MNLIFKKIVILVGVVLAVLIIANFNYFAAQFQYDFFRNIFTPASNNTGIKNNTATSSIPNSLVIESLGIKAPVNYVDQNSEKVFQDVLKSGVVHYPGTALPGQPGNCYIFGHSSDYIWSNGKYKTVFALLPKITSGSAVVISDSAGKVYNYKVIKSFVAAATDVKLLDQSDKTHSYLTLQTSWPLGTALKRWIVIAELE